VTINEIAAFVVSFYDVDSGNSPSGPSARDPDKSQGQGITIDRQLLSKIWTWLGKRPDVSIGEDRKYNKSSLAEVDLEFPGHLGTTVRDDRRRDDAETDSNDSPDTSTTRKSRPKPRHPQPPDGPRFRVNEERMYQAICGHPPDTSKVAPLEFELLSHIAAARSHGILQGELGRLAGQDKRSVPKRTDVLQQKGYIVKESVYRKGNKTSRLILKRFTTELFGVAAQRPGRRDNVKRPSTIRDVVRRIFDVLLDQNLISQADLAEELDLQAPAKLAVLLKILRRLERLKYLKKVKTAVGPSASAGDLKHFVQLLHPPKSEELEDLDKDELPLDQSIQLLASDLGPENGDLVTSGLNAKDDQEEQGRLSHDIAQWNPDRLIANVMADAARLAGESGLTNWVRKLMSKRPKVSNQSLEC